MMYTIDIINNEINMYNEDKKLDLSTLPKWELKQLKACLIALLPNSKNADETKKEIKKINNILNK